MRQVIHGHQELILLIQLILLVGMLAKVFIKALLELMRDLSILHTMRGMEVLKEKPIEKNNGL